MATTSNSIKSAGVSTESTESNSEELVREHFVFIHKIFSSYFTAKGREFEFIEEVCDDFANELLDNLSELKSNEGRRSFIRFTNEHEDELTSYEENQNLMSAVRSDLDGLIEATESFLSDVEQDKEDETSPRLVTDILRLLHNMKGATYRH